MPPIPRIKPYGTIFGVKRILDGSIRFNLAGIHQRLHIHGQGEDEPERERARDIDHERAPREASARKILHPALHEVPRDGTERAANSQEEKGHVRIVARAGPALEVPTVIDS